AASAPRPDEPPVRPVVLAPAPGQPAGRPPSPPQQAQAAPRPAPARPRSLAPLLVLGFAVAAAVLAWVWWLAARGGMR
ncbi:MAG TPA: hypothetical protein VLD85_02120, partial [Anaeromyxobacteraceae bacterium]|nr:hypothetical protein [Anaeromyxobacteraceae bacterium]